MQTRNIIVIGTSAGGVTALKELVSSLPADFKGSIFIVLHIPAYSESRLPSILSKAGPCLHCIPGMEIVLSPERSILLLTTIILYWIKTK